MIFSNGCVQITNTATGAGAAVAFAGQAYRADGTMLVDITTSAIPFSAANHRGMTRWRPDGRLIATKAAVDAASIKDNGITRTADGRQHVVTLGAAGAAVKFIDGLPYDDTGRLRVSEV